MCRRSWRRVPLAGPPLLLVAVAPAAEQRLPLLNGDFEMALQGGQVPGWPAPLARRSSVKTSGCRTSEPTMAVTASASKMTPTSRAWGCAPSRFPRSQASCTSPRLRVQREGTGQLYLEFWNDQGDGFITWSPDRRPRGVDSRAVEELAPPGTTALTLLIYSHSATPASPTTTG